MQRDGGPGGPGAGGNPTGGSFTGPAEALELVGDHCYAYSGVIPVGNDATSADVTMLSFTTGNYYSKVKLNWTNAVIVDANFYEAVQMNGAQIYIQTLDAVPNKFNHVPVKFIIPPYTEFKVLYGSNKSGDNDACVTLTGRIYRG